MADIAPPARRRTHWVLRPMKYYLSLRRRWLGMTPNDVGRKKIVWQRVQLLATLIQQLRDTSIAANEPRLLPTIGALFVEQLSIYREIVMAPSLLNTKLTKITRKGLGINSFTDGNAI